MSKRILINAVAVLGISLSATVVAAPIASAAPPATGSSGLSVGQIDQFIRLFIPGFCTVAGSVGCVNPTSQAN